MGAAQRQLRSILVIEVRVLNLRSFDALLWGAIRSKDIKVVALDVTSSTPNGTATGCVTNVTIVGTGFASLQQLTKPPSMRSSEPSSGSHAPSGRMIEV